MASNYPPGVTGNEYEISGPQHEWRAEARCPLCDTEDVMDHEQHWSFGILVWCSNAQCENAMLGFILDPEDIDYEPDLERD